MFLPQMGTKMFSLDYPIVLPFDTTKANFPLKKDHVEGVQTTYCIKYVTDKAGKVQFTNCGLVFMQHMGVEQHLANLATLAAVMQAQMTWFSGNLAYHMAQNSEKKGKSSSGTNTFEVVDRQGTTLSVQDFDDGTP